MTNLENVHICRMWLIINGDTVHFSPASISRLTAFTADDLPGRL